MPDEPREEAEEVTERIEEESPEQSPEDLPEESGDESEESQEASEPYLSVPFLDGTLTFRTAEEVQERLRESEHLRRSNPRLGAENARMKAQMAEYERVNAEYAQLQPLLQNEAVRRAILAAHYGVDPEVLSQTGNEAVGQVLGQLIPRLSTLESQLKAQETRVNRDELERTYDAFMAANADIKESPTLMQAVAAKIEDIDPPAAELRTAKGMTKWLKIASDLVRAELKPAQIREMQDKAIRDALKTQTDDQQKRKKMAAVVGSGAGKVSVGKIDPKNYEDGVKGSNQLTQDILAKLYGQSGRKG